MRLRCPTGKMIEGYFCVNICAENYLLDGPTCVKACPVDSYEYNRTCQKNCPNATLKENHKCVLNCSSGLFQMKFNCVSKCPTGQFITGSSKCAERCDGVKFYNDSIALCLTECPEDTAEINSTCFLYCPRNRPFFYRKSCLRECPKVSSFISKRTSSHNSLRYVCVDKCPKYISVRSNMCVETCSSNEVLFKNNCQEDCPASDPYGVQLSATSREKITLSTSFNITRPINTFVICAKECPSTFVLDNTGCYPECPHAERNVTYNSSCLQTCPETYPFVARKDDRNECTDRCEKLRFRDTCVEKCPDSHASILDG